MNLLFRVADRYIPACLKKREILNLFRITASAFHLPAPSLAGLSYEESLHEFARFTESAVRRSGIRKSDRADIQEHLFRGAYRFGEKYRKLFSVSSMGDVGAAARMVYRILNIDFTKTEHGIITISRCFFSDFYSSDTCRILSSLDAGLMAGLAGGGMLEFTDRITEGSDCCRARFTIVEGSL